MCVYIYIYVRNKYLMGSACFETELNSILKVRFFQSQTMSSDWRPLIFLQEWFQVKKNTFHVKVKFSPNVKSYCQFTHSAKNSFKLIIHYLNTCIHLQSSYLYTFSSTFVLIFKEPWLIHFSVKLILHRGAKYKTSDILKWVTKMNRLGTIKSH